MSNYGLLATVNANPRQWLAMVCCLVPVTTVILCASWSMQTGLAPACFPLIDGCLSISAACRPEPVVYLFRTIMLPMSGLLLWFWWNHYQFLKRIQPLSPHVNLMVAGLSMIGTVFLPLYVLFLGTDGQFYEFLRRIGIYFFFAGTGFAQLISSFSQHSRIRYQTTQKAIRYQNLCHTLQVVIVTLMLVSGLLNLVLKEVLADPGSAENIIEWNFGLIMFLWYALQGIIYSKQSS